MAHTFPPKVAYSFSTWSATAFFLDLNLPISRRESQRWHAEENTEVNRGIAIKITQISSYWYGELQPCKRHTWDIYYCQQSKKTGDAKGEYTSAHISVVSESGGAAAVGELKTRKQWVDHIADKCIVSDLISDQFIHTMIFYIPFL